LASAIIVENTIVILTLVVAISRRVGSETPITCKLSGLKGVIVEETVWT